MVENAKRTSSNAIIGEYIRKTQLHHPEVSLK